MSLRRRIRRETDAPDRKRKYVRDLFSRVAGRYDLTNDVMSFGLHRRWKDRVLELAEIEPGDHVLDLAAGTGDLALRALPRAGDDGRVVAADLTGEMMRVGQRREGGNRVDWTQADALELPYRGKSFDRVIIGYGLRNFPELEAGLREVRRCLRPNGKLVSLDFGKPPNPALRALYLKYLDASTAVIGWLLHRDPEAYVYIPESLRQYPSQEEVCRTMERAGFRKCGWVDLLFGTMAIHFGRRGSQG